MSDHIINRESGHRELAQYAYDKGQESTAIKMACAARDIYSAQIALIPSGLTVLNLKDILPATPERKEADLTLRSVQSFCEYLNEQKTPATRIFANLDKPPYTFKAIIDWHETAGGVAGWRHHACTLTLNTSEEFFTWKKADGTMLTQTAFAEFLKDNRLDIVEPNGVEILNLVMGLEANQENRVTGRLATNHGSRISFETETRTSSGGVAVVIPEKITVALPFFVGTPPEQVEADFKFRLKDGQITFGYRLLGIDRMIRASALACANQIRTETQVPIFI